MADFVPYTGDIKTLSKEPPAIKEPEYVPYTGDIKSLSKKPPEPEYVPYTGDIKTLSKEPIKPEEKTKTPEDIELEQIKKDYAISSDMGTFDYATRVAKRAGEKGIIGWKQSVNGLQRFAEDTFDSDSTDSQKRLEHLANIQKTIGNPTSHTAELIEGAASSIVQQLPILLGSMLTGPAAKPVALTGMFLQSFGQTYDESRRDKMDYTEALGRSAAFGALEVVGESLGLGPELQAIKAATKGKPVKDIAKYAAKALVGEIAGEEVTYAGQFGVDKAYGKQKEATIESFIQGAVDTAISTALQGGMMFGGNAAVSKAVSTFTKNKEEEQQNTEQQAAAVKQARLDEVTAKLKQNLNLTDEQAVIQAQEVIKQEDIIANQKAAIPPVSTEAPPITPPVLSADGTPIPIKPLDQLNTPVLEQTQPTITPEQKIKIDAETTRLMSEGNFSREDATKVAIQEILGEMPNGTSTGTITGAVKPSIPVSGQGTTNTPPLATPIVAGLANNIEPVGGVGTGKEIPTNVQQGTLSTTQQVVQQTAADYLTKLDSKVEKPNASKLKGMLNMLRIPMPETGKGFNERAIQALKEAVSPPSTTTAPTQVAPPVSPTPTTETAETSVPVAETTTPVEVVPPIVETRGRPKIEKTPEQIVAAAATKAEQSAANKKEVREIAKLIETLKQNTERASQVAQMSADKKQEHRAARINVLGQLDDIARGQAKDRAAGKNAKATLANITEEERRVLDTRRTERAKLTPEQRAVIDTEAKAKVGTENNLDSIRKRALQILGKASKSQTTNSKPNTAFNGENINTAEQALNIVNKTGTFFERTLVRALKPFMKDVGFVVVNSTQDLKGVAVNGESLADIMKKNGSTNGMKVDIRLPDGTLKTMIYVRGDGYGPSYMHGINNTVVLHEALHVALDSMLVRYLESPETSSPKVKALYDNLFRLMLRAEDAYNIRKNSGEELSPELQALVDKKGIDAFGDPREFLSYGLTDQDLIQFLMETSGVAKKGSPGFFGSLFTRFANTLRNALGMDAKHDSAMQDLILLGSGLLAEKPAATTKEGVSLSQKKQNITLKKLVNVLKVSNDAHEIGNAMGDAYKAKDFNAIKNLMGIRWNSMKPKFVEKSLYILPTPDILRWLKTIKLVPDLTGVKDKAAIKAIEKSLVGSTDRFHSILSSIDETAQTMSAMRGRMQEAANVISKDLKTFIFKEAGNGQLLANAMHFARLTGISPAEVSTNFPGKKVNIHEIILNDEIVKDIMLRIQEATLTGNVTEETRLKKSYDNRTNAIKEAHNAWEELSKRKGGVEMYERVRNFYKDNLALTRTLLDSNIKKLNLSATDSKNLMAYIHKMQTDSKINEYFPFARHGIYWFNLSKGPADREFILFDSAADRDTYMDKRVKELGLTEAEKRERITAGNDITELSHKNMSDSATAALKDMFEILDAASTGTKTVDIDTIKDQLYQTWLQTAPEKSFRKQFQHADNVAGFSADILRTFNTSAQRYAGQLSKLKYAGDIRDTTTRAREYLKGMAVEDQIKLGLFIDEMSSRAEQELTPENPNSVAKKINELAYYWLLTAPASAAVQLISVPAMVLPTLIESYGAINASKMFAKHSAIWHSVGVSKTNAAGDTEWTAPTVQNSALVKSNKELEIAFEKAREQYNLFSLTNNAAIGNLNKTPRSERDSFARKMGSGIASTMSGLFNGAERISREMSFAMVFELEYAKTKNMDASVKHAVLTTQELLGRYDNMSRAGILRNFAGNTIGQFKTYAANVTSYLVRNGYAMIKLSTPLEERTAAATRLIGTLAMGGLFHGMVGMPLYSVVCFAIDETLKLIEGDDNEDRKRRRRENPFTADNSNLRFRYEYLPRVFGKGYAEAIEKGPISALTDLNIGSRTSFDGLWFRDSKPGKTTSESFQNFIVANLGPGISTIFNMVSSLDDFAAGHTERALEKLLPAFFKNPLVSYRLASEGAETKGGQNILKPEEITTLNIIAQALGFQSTRLSRLQEEGFESKKELEKGSQDRAKILQRLDETFLNPKATEKDKQQVINQIRQFNNRYPDPDLKFMIDGDTIDASLDKAMEGMEYTYRGQQMKESNVAYLLKLRKAAAP